MTQKISEAEFLKRVRDLYGISRIYYPGHGGDTFLEDAFKPSEIVYLDDEGDDAIIYKPNRMYVKGDFGKSPFRNGTFDALFYQENHANLWQTIEMLRTLRRGGVVIHGIDFCFLQSVDEEDFARIPGCVKVELPFYNPTYTIFQKRYNSLTPFMQGLHKLLNTA